MNNSKIFKILYYIAFLITISLWFYTVNVINVYGNIEATSINILLAIINLILVIIFSVKIIKNKLKDINILFPIVYILFTIIVIILVFMINNKLIISYIHYTYYMSFILFNYILLNLYSILSITKK